MQVFEGDITDADLLEETDIGRFDAVAALTGEDEANILACLYAKSVGASETIACGAQAGPACRCWIRPAWMWRCRPAPPPPTV